MPTRLIYQAWKFQSTHSRGVRHRITPNIIAIENFNPRTHEECDILAVFLIYRNLQFQSTHSRGVRPFAFWSKSPVYSNFNPRTHEECDDEVKAKAKQIKNFNPRTHEECDQNSRTNSISPCISIHALTRSATRCYTRLHLT